MTKEELDNAVKVIKESQKEIGLDNIKRLYKELDASLKEKYSEEKWRVYEVANGASEEEEAKLIEEIGQERYRELLDEIINELKEENEEFLKKIEQEKTSQE